MYRITMISLLTGIALLYSSSVQGGSQNFESLPVGRLDMNNKITQNGITIEFNQADKDRTGFAEIVSSPNQDDSSSTKILHTNNLLTEFYFSSSSEVRDVSFELVSASKFLGVNINGMGMVTLSNLQEPNLTLQFPGFDVSMSTDSDTQMLFQPTGRKPIRSVEFLSTSLGIANVSSYVSALNIPEPQSLALCLLGLSGLALRRWRQVPEGVGDVSNSL